MAIFSVSAFVNYTNDTVNNKETELSSAFRKDVKEAIKLCGYPTKDEIDIVDTVEGLKMSNVAAAIPAHIGTFMKDEDRDFEIPATDEETCPAAISRVHKDEVTKEGVSMMGGVEKKWTSTVKAHNEYFVKNKRKAFKA